MANNVAMSKKSSRDIFILNSHIRLLVAELRQ
jgi:hypothetical protein